MGKVPSAWLRKLFNRGGRQSSFSRFRDCESPENRGICLLYTSPPLPSGFNINGYLIQSLKQTDPLCHVYFAADSSHVQYLVREFCPQGLAVRDPESGKLRYPCLLYTSAFHERAKKAYAVVITGETAKYGNIILKKGVTPAV